ncbi:MAG TPA: transglycosylase SLT domain-containing protein [Thermodesulfobacteriota bacterium]|nr:transglycosylase SLT domain-containing protein [Thermodesulfobacteriota bacterium]
MSGRIRSYLMGIGFFFLFISIARADLNKQRQYFLDAEDAFKKGNQAKFSKLLTRLKDYPLYPYLVFMDTQKNIRIDREKEILSFISEYESSPLSGRLRKAWLEYLAGQNQWQRLARDFREPAPPFLQYAYVRALLETGEIDKAWAQAEKLWHYKGYLPGECYPVFDFFYAHKKLTPDLVWQRIELTMAQQQTALAVYLKRYLPTDEKPWVDLWVDMFNQPTKILDMDWSKVDRGVAGKILSQAMGRLIRQDTPWAVWAFDTLKAKQDLSQLDLSSIEQEIAQYLAFRRYPQALERMVSLPDHVMTPKLREWRIRAALLRQDWKAVLSGWDHLDVQEKTEPRWLYWKARALAALGRSQEASAIYREIAGQQNYFSLLAADRLNQTCHFNHRPLSATEEDMLKFRQEPGIRRVVELVYLGRIGDARREWIFLLKEKGPTQQSAAAIMAHDMGWNDRAIRAAAAAGGCDDLVVSFPLCYAESINRYAGKNSLDPGWIFALIRQESMFVADAKSPAGALGVMQIMPDTGKRIASHLGEPFPNPSLLLSPEKNIKYGTCYLKMRLDDLQRNPVLASAAYNAGPRMVRKWLPIEGSMPADIWVEIIPFFETRNYIEKIFTYKAVYRQRLGREPERLSDQMPVVFSEKE